MLPGSAGQQKSGSSQHTPGRSGEAAELGGRDEARPARHEQTDSGAGDLLAKALARKYMAAA